MIRRHVVGDENVQTSVLIKLADDQAEPSSQIVFFQPVIRHIEQRPVATSSPNAIMLRIERQWRTRSRLPDLLIKTFFLIGSVSATVANREQIGMGVTIDIGDRHRRGPFTF